MPNITDAIFHDEVKAREFLEKQRWPHGVICPFCNSKASVSRLGGQSMGPGWFVCNACSQVKFTVRTGSVMERSHVPLAKWAMAFRLFAASKKGMSAKQLERMLGVSYRTAWFIGHRIREAMRMDVAAGPIGGSGKTVESDETFVGGKAKNAHKNKPIPKKHAVHALVERGGAVRASHVPDVTAKTLRKAIAKHVDPKSTMNTDDALAYYFMSREFAAHGTVNHSQGEYVSKDGKTHIQHGRGVLRHIQARRHGLIPLHQRAALAALSERVRVQVERTIGTRGRGCRACGDDRQGRRRQALDLPAASRRNQTRSS